MLIVVVALEDTATNAAQIAKAAGEKEARFATPEVVKETLDVSVEEGNSASSLNCAIFFSPVY